MGYFYAVMWLVVGVTLIFSLAKENKIFYFAGGFFTLLGIWWAADSFFEEDLFSGTWRTALNAVTIVALVVLSVVFFLERQRSIKKEMLEQKAAREEAAKRAEAAEKAREAEQAAQLEEAAFAPGPEDSLRASVAGINIMRPRLDPDEETETEEK